MLLSILAFVQQKSIMFLSYSKKNKSMINIIWIMNDLKFTNGSVSEVVKGMKIEKQSLI